MLTAPTDVTARAGPRHPGRLAIRPGHGFPMITALGHPAYPSVASAPERVDLYLGNLEAY